MIQEDTTCHQPTVHATHTHDSIAVYGRRPWFTPPPLSHIHLMAVAGGTSTGLFYKIILPRAYIICSGEIMYVRASTCLALTSPSLFLL